jgi:uridine nucleosidase
MSESVWLDCDPGTVSLNLFFYCLVIYNFCNKDDAFAILMASYNRNVNLIGISTVAGNQLIEKTTNNALNVLNIIGSLNDDGLSIPLIQGYHKPLFRHTLISNEEIFGILTLLLL